MSLLAALCLLVPMLQEIAFEQGVFVDDSALAARGRYVAADNVRFARGKAQSRYGNEKFSTSALTGIARGIHAWADNSRIPYLAVGTHLRLYASDQNGIVYDITPVSSFGYLVSPFATDGTTATITVTHASHGLVDTQAVSWPTVTAINGATVTPTTKYAVTVTDANTYTFTADTVSTSAGTPTVSPDYRYYLAPGNLDGLGGQGFGTGGYGSGNYGGGNSGLTLYPRTWSFAFWGKNLIANPRGGAIFEWAPNVTASELVTNAAFTASANWSAGAGWSVGGGNAQASATSSALQQTVSLQIGAWHLLHVVVSVGSGSFNVNVGSTTIQACTATGRYNQPFWNGGSSSALVKIDPAGLTANVTQVSVQVMTSAQRILPSSPSPTTCIFSTAERILVACGINDTSGNFDPMKVGWSDRENNQSWTGTASNLAGAYTLTNGTRIVRGIEGSGENLIFTDTTMYAMRSVPSPDVVYDFTDIGKGTGLISPNAVCVQNGVVYWKAPNGQDYMYAGSFPQPIASNTMRRDFNDNLSWVQQDKIWSAPIGAWNEIQHIYPDVRDGTECSRYNKHQFTDDVWDPGTTAFTCWLDQGVFQYPIAVDTSGYIRYCEKGQSVDGAALSWYITSAKTRQEGGYKQFAINGVQLDAAGLMGGYQLDVLATWKDVRGIFTKTFGPYNANAMSGTVSARAKGQFLQFTWSGTASPSFWRAGADLFDMVADGDR